MIRRVEGGGERRSQADAAGRARHDRQQRDGIEQAHLSAATQNAGEAAAIKIVQPKDVGKEQTVELARFQHARDVLVPFGGEEAEIGFRMTPGAPACPA